MESDRVRSAILAASLAINDWRLRSPEWMWRDRSERLSGSGASPYKGTSDESDSLSERASSTSPVIVGVSVSVPVLAGPALARSILSDFRRDPWTAPAILFALYMAWVWEIRV